MRFSMISPGSVTGIDISAEMIAIARRNFASFDAVQLVGANFETWAQNVLAICSSRTPAIAPSRHPLAGAPHSSYRGDEQSELG